MALTVAEIEAEIRKLNAAGQSYTIGDQGVTRADLRYLLQALKAAEAKERAASQTIFQRVRMGRLQ